MITTLFLCSLVSCWWDQSKRPQYGPRYCHTLNNHFTVFGILFLQLLLSTIFTFFPCVFNSLPFCSCGTDIIIVVAALTLVGLFSMQHYGTDRVGWLFAPIVLLWFLTIGGIGMYNIWKYDSSVLKAFSPVYIYRYFRRNGKNGWTSLGGIMLSITGKVSGSISFFLFIYTCSLVKA